MANEDIRVINQTERTTLDGGEFVLLDDSTDGSSKITPDNLVRNTAAYTGLRSDLGELSNLDTTNKSSIVNAINEVAGGSGSGLTADIKTSLLQIAQKVAYIDDDGQDYYDDLYDALYPPAPPATLTSIDAVYVQSGTVYTSDSLDSLKTDLTVTAHYDDQSSQVVNTYTLSGTLVSGESTITVAYGGMTDTFTVTATAWSTAPVIAKEDVTFNSSGEEKSLTGSCITIPYEYELDIDAFKETTYYDATNNYSTINGTLGVVKYSFPNSAGISFGANGKSIIRDSSDETLISYISTNRTGTETQWLFARYNTGFFTLSDNKIHFVFNLSTADIDDSYVYWSRLNANCPMPVGVSEGDIIFAGANTSYYNKHNISEVTS